ncbi:MAG: ankyrin repeat domain-containing protein [Gammaproteobacteria bacterium]
MNSFDAELQRVLFPVSVSECPVSTPTQNQNTSSWLFENRNEAAFANVTDVVQRLCVDQCGHDLRGPTTHTHLFAPPRENQQALSVFLKACQLGRVDLVDLMISQGGVDPSVNHSEGLYSAVLRGNTEIVALLLKDGRANPGAGDNVNIQDASRKGYSEIVALLLQDPRVDPTEDNHKALRDAVYRGHDKTVRVLLSDRRLDPSVDDYSVIRNALFQGRTDIIHLIAQHPNTYVDGKLPRRPEIREALLSAISQPAVQFDALKRLAESERRAPDVLDALAHRHTVALDRVLLIANSAEWQTLSEDVQSLISHNAFDGALFPLLPQAQRRVQIDHLLRDLSARARRQGVALSSC